MSESALPTGRAASAGEAAGLEISLVGPMEVRLGPHLLPRLRSRKGLWLLALLALRGGRPVERGWLAGTLWPECDEPHARRNLRQSLYDLRLALGPEAWRLTCEASQTIRLDLRGASVDVLAFDAAVERGDLSSLEAAVRLYRGPLLEDCIEAWSLEERRRREQAYLAALERLATSATARHEHAAAASYLRLAVGADPYREELQRALMQALAAGDNPTGSLLAYQQFRELLWREMAAEPAEETTALFRRLREETRARPLRRCAPVPRAPAPPAAATPRSEGSPRSPAPGPRGNLPQPLSPFVGREAALLNLSACLASARLVTLTGAGGIGKTRLAIRLAEECASGFADGAWFVDLAALADPALVPQAVARVLRVQESPGAPLTETLQDALVDRQLLLVLDNCEHLIDACASLAEALLSGCPPLRLLATSRQVLGLNGEVAWPVPPLSLPPGGEESDGRIAGLGRGRFLPDPRSLAPDTLLQYEAIHLFVQRAAAASGFTLAESNAMATIQVCRRLDGIPLAIDLAAARLKLLSIEQLAARLDDRFRLLTGGSRTALPRQQTLRATLDWSYELLAAPERILLRRLSVFTGGFTLEAAEAVCSDFGFWILDFGLGPTKMGDPAESATAPDPTTASDRPESLTLPAIQNPKSKIQNTEVLDLLSQLVDKSLVGVERRNGVARYGLLEMTRDYARDRLRDAEEGDEPRARHAQFFLTLAERAGPELRGACQAEWLHRLEEEHNNFRAAIDYFQAQGAMEEGLRLVGVLGWFWWMRGYLSEGRERLQALLAQSGYEIGSMETGKDVLVLRSAEQAGPSELSRPSVRLAQAKALNAAGMLADEQGDYGTARALFQESLDLCRELSDPLGAAMALNNLGGQAMQVRDHPAARAFYEECLALSRRIGDQWWTAAALTNLGRAALQEGEHATARAFVQGGLEIQRQLQDRRAIARSLSTLGLIAERQGDYEAAHALNEESLSLARQLGTTVGIEEALRVLGSIARERGDHDAALTYHEERLAIAREVGSAWGAAESLYYLGLLARDRGEPGPAAAFWTESLSVSQRLGDMHRVAECLEGFASLAAQSRSTEPGQSDRWHSGSDEPCSEPDSAQRAARLFGAAAALRDVAGAPVPLRGRADYEHDVAAARASLDAAAFAAAWAEGQAMTLEQAVCAALKDSDTSSTEGE